METKNEQIKVNLPDYQQRMIDEYVELNDRIAKLSAFAQTETHHNLPVQEQTDMCAQFHAMVIYKMTLANRLQRAGLEDVIVLADEKYERGVSPA